MLFFYQKTKTQPIEPSDAAWLAHGYERFGRLLGNYDGSPERLAEGGEIELGAGDLAAALFMYARAIDRMEFQYSTVSTREFGRDDLVIFDKYNALLRQVTVQHPAAPVIDGHTYNVKYTLAMMRAVAMAAERAGIDARPYYERAYTLCELTGMQPYW